MFLVWHDNKEASRSVSAVFCTFTGINNQIKLTAALPTSRGYYSACSALINSRCYKTYSS